MMRDWDTEKMGKNPKPICPFAYLLPYCISVWFIAERKPSRKPNSITTSTFNHTYSPFLHCK